MSWGEGMQKIVFVVDDSITNLVSTEEALRKHYQAITMSSAARMFTALEKVVPDLILLDIDMPEMNGYEAMKRLKANMVFTDIPVIFLTALDDAINEAYGIQLGAVDFITKPFSEAVLLNRIKNHLQIDDLIRERTEQLRLRTVQLMKLQNSIINTLAEVVEKRDSNTGNHIERTSTYMRILIEAMLEFKVYSEELGQWDLESVISSARLHDLGKISIPDSILNKADTLTPEEFQLIKGHSISGEQIIESMVKQTGGGEFLRNAQHAATYHHERWDGTGYPHGLKGEEIPLLGRIMAIVDVYDALTSERSYKKAYTHGEAILLILNDSAGYFDPLIVDVFIDIQDRFEKALDGFLQEMAS